MMSMMSMTMSNTSTIDLTNSSSSSTCNNDNSSKRTSLTIIDERKVVGTAGNNTIDVPFINLKENNRRRSSITVSSLATASSPFSVF